MHKSNSHNSFVINKSRNREDKFQPTKYGKSNSYTGLDKEASKTDEDQ